MRILYCHGAGSEPQGTWVQALRAAGYELLAPDYRGLDVDTAADLIRYQILDQASPPIVVGHSFGGAVSLLAAIRAEGAGGLTAGLVLGAPALFLAEAVAHPNRLRCPAVPVILMHGIRDEKIPIELSRGFAREHDVQLIEVDDDHRLGCSHDVMLEAVAALSGGAHGRP